MCQLWMKFNQAKIVFMPAHRYNLGRCSSTEWTFLDQQLKILAKYEDNVIAAISRYDVEYLHFYTGLKPLFVPSYAGFYLNSLYESEKVTSATYLIFTVKDRNDEFIKNVKSALKPVNLQAEFVYDAYKFYEPADLLRHPAVISLPYSVMSLRTTELYSMAVPLFIPSIKFYLARNGMGHDRTSTTEPYCDKDPNLEAKIRPSIDLRYSTHPYSPNTEIYQDPEAEMYWMQLADFYDWPHIIHFDSYDHLKELLLTTDLKTVSANMKEELAFRKLHSTQSWCDISKRIVSTSP